jgi:UDP-galactopyranose mutase
MKSYLVVGAGFVGSVIARELAEAGHKVTVIDQRDHIGGNAFDHENEHGERVHDYGPHLFHGSKDSIAVKWLSKFTEWIPYEHKVRALLEDGRTTPLPVNANTLEDVFGIELETEDSARELLDGLRDKAIVTPKNTDEVFLKSVGTALANIFFRPYTLKMWSKPATEIDAKVGARIPTRANRDDRYFTDDFQAMPKDGYTAMFEKILDHPNITVKLGIKYTRHAEDFFTHTFLSVPIDRYYDCCFGKLPYRSIRFISGEVDEDQKAATVNFTDDGLYTRSTQWSLISNSGRNESGPHQVTLEVPCSPEDNDDECYYPIRNEASLELLGNYQKLAEEEGNLTFCGRLGWYEYLDMVPAITKALQTVKPYVTVEEVAHTSTQGTPNGVL